MTISFLSEEYLNWISAKVLGEPYKPAMASTTSKHQVPYPHHIEPIKNMQRTITMQDLNCNCWHFRINEPDKFRAVSAASVTHLSFFLSLYTARPSFEYYRQVYFVHSGLQDESLQVTISKSP